MARMGHAFRLALFAFILSAGISLYLTFFVAANVKRIETLEFHRAAEKLMAFLHERMEVYESTVNGTVGLFAASVYVDRDEFRAYIESLKLSQRYPGISTIRYIEKVSREKLEEFVSRVQGEGFPHFEIFPRNGQAEHFVITYVEPLAENIRALGYDAAQDPSRRRALEETRDTGDITVSDSVKLPVKETMETGFVLYRAVYRNGADLSTVADRRAALIGFVSVAFLTENLFGGMAKDVAGHSDIGFEIYAEDPPIPAHLIYSSQGKPSILDRSFRPHFIEKKTLEVGHEVWSVHVFAQHMLHPASAEKRLPGATFFMGILLSALVSIAVFAARVALLRRKELIAVNEKLARERQEHLERELAMSRNKEEEIKRLNEDLELRVMERTADLEAFSYSVSHDLRSPLIAISGFTNALAEDYGDRLEDEAKRYLRLVSVNAKSMGELIDDLLAFSRLGRQVVKFTDQIDMKRLAREAFDALRTAQKDRNIEFHLRDLPPVRGDASLMKQVWANLLSNAVKFTGKTPKAVIEAGSYKKNGERVYYVKDNGAGFDMAYANKLFQVFQRLHSKEQFEGTGVGLAIVQRVVSRHGGHVWAEGKPGEGAVVYFSIPDLVYAREGDKTWLTSMKSRSS